MASSGGQSGWLKTNQGISVCLAVACLILLGYLLGEEWVYQQQRDGFRLGFFTIVSAGAMMVCVMAMMFDKQKRETTPEMATMRSIYWLYGLIALFVMLVYYTLAWDAHFSQPGLRAVLDVIPFTGDFLFWTTIFLTGGMFVLGVRPFTSAITVGVIVSIVIFGLFLLIGIDLPRALVGQVLGSVT